MIKSFPIYHWQIALIPESQLDRSHFRAILPQASSGAHLNQR